MTPNLTRALKKYQLIAKSLIHPTGYFIYPKNLYKYHNLSFSQEGEDRVLHRIFEGKKKGFYIDVGAYHPQRFSNTYLFYLSGWKGINIDASPENIKRFTNLRPRDINLSIAISDTCQELTFYTYKESALNTFSYELA
ncbi:FkbM family methyltransferase [Leptothoe sp. PORK10 BA2]|uniref:FkbM family methyltransferase n=1 Tax=Leptothoe sp. PORK10 BA2 TaxID=3110254 RepID=UPI002B1EE5A9|nr:FkbM family methyltransferase [Leptothoe sp. PORK10 BA2]MEA5463494.1 FkbM family methyltransferase [Leptothoe sp. PORK10 BA2]